MKQGCPLKSVLCFRFSGRVTEKGATGDFFFFIFAKKCGSQTGYNFDHPLDRKQTFFYGQPNEYEVFASIKGNVMQ